MTSNYSASPTGGQIFYQYQFDAQQQEQQSPSHSQSINGHLGSAAYIQNHSHTQGTQLSHVQSSTINQVYQVSHVNHHTHGYPSQPDSYHYDPRRAPSQSISLQRSGLDLLNDPPEGDNPQYSVKVLIEYAIKGSLTGRMSLSDIYEAVESRYPQLKFAGSNWRNSARHDISSDPRFIKKPRLDYEPGRGNMWTFDPSAPPKAPKPRRKRRLPHRP